MSTDRETTRLVRSWLDEGVTRLPDRVLDAVLDQVPATPQRRSPWSAWRPTYMSTYAKLAAAAAAVLVVAVLGFNLLPGISGPGASPAPSPTHAPTPPPTLAPTPPPTLPRAGAVEPGTYLVSSNTQTPFLVTVPTGWTVDSGMLHKGDFYDSTANAVLFRPWTVTHVYANACVWRGAMEAIGPTKAALVAALTAQTGRNAEGPDEVVLGGLPASRFVFSVPTGFDAASCDDGYLRPFPGPGGNEAVSPPMFLRSITTIYVVETNGKATAIQAARYEGSSAADVAELQSLVESIVFQP